VKPEPETAAADLVVGGNFGAESTGTCLRMLALGRSLAEQPVVRALSCERIGGHMAKEGLFV
jgi:hypothetical protein